MTTFVIKDARTGLPVTRETIEDRFTAISVPMFQNLQAGDCLKIRFGNCGTQSARVQRWTRNGKLKVRKYLKKSDRWTNPITIGRSEIIAIVQLG